jgi:plastocyanin
VIRPPLAAALLLLSAGCGGEEAPRAHLVELRGFAFAPAALSVAAGDTVVWRNADIVPHTATAAGEWDSGSIASGGEWRWVAEPGEYDYGCSLHPTMLGTLSVTAPG